MTALTIAACLQTQNCCLSGCFLLHYIFKNENGLSLKIQTSSSLYSYTLREKRRLRALENRVMRRIFVPKRDEVTGEWRKLHNDELNDLYCSPNIFRVIKSR